MKKHILFIVENQTVPYDRRVWSEALAAKEWGYDVSVISPRTSNHPEKFENISGIDIYRYPQPFEAKNKLGYFLEYFNALFFQFILSMKLLVRKPFHVIHGANPPDNIFILALFYRMFNIRYIFDHHDLCSALYQVKFGRKDLLFKLTSLTEFLSFKSADIIISTNESYRDIAVSKLNGNCGKNVFVVRNGPDTHRIRIRSIEKDYRSGFNYLVGYVGTIARQEGIGILLRIIRYIVEDKGRHDIKFIVIGSGTDLNDYIRLSREMALTDYVEFTGYVPYEELIGILQQCDIGINPEHTNTYTDKSTMMKIMDYMLAGRPVIQFESTEGRNTAGDSSLYISGNDEYRFAEQIITLLENPRKRSEMGEKGRKRIDEKLNWSIQKENLKRAYDHLEFSGQMSMFSRSVQEGLKTTLSAWAGLIEPANPFWTHKD